MSQEYTCEMDLDGKKVGDSKRKGFEGCIKCIYKSPSQTSSQTSSRYTSQGGRAHHSLSDVMVYGTLTNPSKLRSFAGLGKQTKIPTITLTRLAKVDGKVEDTAIQKLVLTDTIISQLDIDDEGNTFNATLSYTIIEIDDYEIDEKGKVNGKSVIKYNRLTNAAG